MIAVLRTFALSVILFLCYEYSIGQCSCYLDINSSHKNAIQNCLNGSITVNVNGDLCNSLSAAVVSLRNANTFQIVAQQMTFQVPGFIKFDNIPAGNYAIIASHACSLPDTCYDSVPVVPSDPVFNGVSTDITAFGCNNGTIGIEITGDYCPATLKIVCIDTLVPQSFISFSQTSYCSFCYVAENLKAGTYKVMLIDSVNLNQHIKYLTITEPPCNFNITANQSRSVACSPEKIEVHLQGDFCLSNVFSLRLYNSLMKLKDSIINQVLNDTIIHFNNVVGGTYTVTANYANGCTSSATVTVVKHCAIPLNLIDSALSTTSRKLMWSGYSCMAGYEVFYKKNGTTTWQKVTMTGNSDTTLIINGLIPGAQYSWKVRSKCTASLKSAFTAIKKFKQPTSIRSSTPESISQIIIRPNPVHDVFSVDINYSDNIGTVTEIFYNSIGEEIFIRTNCKSTETYDLSNYQKGIYFCKVMYDDKVAILKIVH